MTKRIALVGNPNCGKTTMFNKLTGSSQKVGNWPGVTIDRKEGKLKKADDIVIVDLPGIYSLSPYSPEEIVSRNYLVNERPEAIVNIVDASNIERNLYLTTQLLEFGIPAVLALNMMDTVRNEGTEIDAKKLEEELGCVVVETSALRNEGIDNVRNEIVKISDEEQNAKVLRFSDRLEKRISEVEEIISGRVPEKSTRWYAVKLLERDEIVCGELDEDLMTEVGKVISDFEAEYGDDADGVITDERYDLIGKIVKKCVKKNTEEGEIKITLSDRADRIVTNRWLGLPVFFLIMLGVYYVSIQTLGGWATDWINDDVFGVWMEDASAWFESSGVEPWISGLVVDGIMGGVFAVLGFLPQMIILFLMLIILEECGYMARVAFVMDRVFRRFGLSGKSFIPVLIGMGCAVPGIMASRTIESERDRRITAMTVSFIPCGAKLPIIALIAGALFGQSALIAASMYIIGVLCVLMSGIILKKWKSLSGKPSPFIMELPPYHCPTIFNVVSGTAIRAWAFVKKAGTFILLACALVWFLSSFDWSLSMVEDSADSILADIGNVFRYLFIPLGWGDEWEWTVATINGLLAKENVVGTLGVLFGFEEVGEAGEEIWDVIKVSLSSAAGYSFLLFNMLCAPCFAAIGAMRRELGSWKATGCAVVYQCLLAYAIALIFYQICIMLQGDVSWMIVLAIAALAIVGYLFAAKDPFRHLRKAEGEKA